MTAETTGEIFTPFYPINSDGSVNLSTSLLIYKKVERILLDNGKQMIKAEFIRYKHDTHKFLYEMRFKQEIDRLTNIFYIDPYNRNIINSEFEILAKCTLVS